MTKILAGVQEVQLAGGYVRELVKNVVILAGATYEEPVIRDYLKSQSGGVHVTCTQSHDIYFKPYGTQNGVPSTMNTITVKAGASSQSGFTAYDMSSIFKTIGAGRYRIKNTGAVDCTASVWEVVKP